MLLDTIATKEQLATALGVTFQKHIVYYLYRMPAATRYRPFEIKKRSGGMRTISAPHYGLKIVQKRLAALLAENYGRRSGVHGYIAGRSIITNASAHVRQAHVLNIDLKDFFSSINFGRVRGILMSSMYRANEEVATTIAQLCCLENSLPQGAPTSPVISNMICAKLDADLRALAKEHRCIYTRYSDDITISSNRKSYPPAIASIQRIDNERTVILGDKLRDIIRRHGFNINDSKTRLLAPEDRQDVTGLVTNRFVNIPRTYIKSIRGALHALKRYGLQAAEDRFNAVYDHRTREKSDFQSVIFGRIQFVGAVRGYDDRIYRNLRRAFNQLSTLKIPLHETTWDFKLENAIFVIEYLSDVTKGGVSTEDFGQGTAFYLKGTGVVTCAHCVGGKRTYMYHPADPTKEYELEVVSINRDIDLAILQPSDQSILPKAEFAISDDSQFVERGDGITLAGWPSYGPGSQLSVKEGKVQSVKIKSAIRRFNISTPIIEGNSGGPVFNLRGQVIGVAVTGAASAADEDKTEAHGVIPVVALEHLKAV